MSDFDFGCAKKMPILVLMSLLFMTPRSSAARAVKEGADVPKLQNPMSVKYLKENLRKTKPRMVFNDEIVANLREKIKTDPVIGNLYRAIRGNARKILELPLISRVKTSNAMLDVSREMLRRVNMLGVVYLVERDPSILERLDREILATCRFSDWNPPVYLDVAEICMAVALALDWTCDRLPEATRRIAKNALREKGIYPSWPEHGGTRQWWVAHPNNWNQVCNGGMIAASLALAEDDPELAAKTIARALEGLNPVLAEYMPDGVYPESPMYWEYGTSYSVLAASMLETAFGTDFGHKKVPGFMESATFKMMCSRLPSGWYYNFADCKDKPDVDGDVILAWFAAQTGESMFYEKEKFLRPSEDIRLSYLTGAALAWMSRYQEKSNRKPPVSWVGKGKTPIAVFRGDTEGSDYYFAAKGGCGAVSHGNMDAGSFIFELEGVRWSVDPGTQSYMIGEQGFDLWSQCQDCERWQLLTKNNFGHSTLTVNGERHKVDGYASVTDFSLGKNPNVTFDLTPSLGDLVGQAKRTFTKEDGNALLVEDDIKTNEKTKTVTWQLVTQAEVGIVDEGAVLKQDGRTLKLKNLSHPDIPLRVVSLNPPPHKLDKAMENLKRIELRLPVPVDAGTVGGLKIRMRLERN